jgi:hypothetical protein
VLKFPLQLPDMVYNYISNNNKKKEKTMAINKNLVISIVIILFILAVFVGELFPIATYNGSGSGYDEGGQSGTSGIKEFNLGIEGLIIEGAGYFLRSQSDFLLLLNKIELSTLEGINYTEMQNLLNSAIHNMEKARQEYGRLVEIAYVTPYRQEVIEKLKAFDYDGLLEEKGLNAVIFKDMEHYLKAGNLRALHSRAFFDTINILSMLYRLKPGIDSGQFPVLEDLWRLNQAYAEAHLLGQYTTEIFDRLK